MYLQAVIFRRQSAGMMDPMSPGPTSEGLVAGGKCFSTDHRRPERVRNEILLSLEQHL